MIFRVLHYNPLSANQLRLEEILQATRNFSIVGLVATQRRAPVGLEIGSSRQFGCTIVEAGWARAPLSNKSSGVLLALRKPFTTEHIHQTWTPPPSLQGRALAARLKGGFFDLFVCCMYLPPRPQTASKRGGYQRTVEALLEWLDERLSEQKHRTTPIVLMDANDGIGLELRAGRYRSVETQCIAAAGLRREHAAGKRLREIMEKHHMRATSAEMGGPTWFGNEGQASLIDYVWAPAALPLRCSGPLRRLAAELQLISTRQLRDHVPLGLEFDYVQLAGQPASGEREAWNADALMEGVRVGTKRSEFLAALEDRVGAEEARWTPLLELHYPDLLDDYLNEILVETGQRFFKKEPMDAPDYSDLAAKRRELLVQRLEARKSIGEDRLLGQEGVESAEELQQRVRTAKEQLASTSAILKAIRLRLRRRRQSFYEEELRLAWKRRDLAATFRWSRLLGGRRWGAKKRDYRAMSAALPLKKAWKDEWTKPGAEGGMGAVELESWSEWRIQSRNLVRRSELNARVSEDARRDLEELKSSYRTVKKRRACPAGTPPAELWTMLLHASRNLSPAGLGIGYQRKRIEPVRTLSLLERLLCRVRSSCAAPLAWHHSSGAPLHKSNKAGPKGKRVVHVLPSIGKQFFKVLLGTRRDGWTPPAPADWLHGYIPGRRRESAILIRQATTWRLERLGLKSLTAFHDLTNAFGSVKWEAMDRAAAALLGPNHLLGQQRYRLATTTIPGNDGDISLKIGEGGLMGDPLMVALFWVAFLPSTIRWQQLVAEEGAESGQLLAWHPWSGERMDLSLSQYADDTTKQIVAEPGEDVQALGKASAVLQRRI